MTTKYLVRLANTDLDGNKQIAYALCKVKGVKYSFANALCVIGGIDPQKKAGDLSEGEEKQINILLKDPTGVPKWMRNRQRDPETGQDLHLTGPDVNFVRDNDIKMMKKIKSYKGVRHTHNLPVRGQRTKSNFRRNKTRGASRRKKR